MPPFFQKRLVNKQLFIKRVKHYHQWLCTAIPLKAKLDQISSDSIRIQDQALADCIQSLLSKNSRVHQALPDSRGMGIVNRPIGRLPSHPHPPKLKEIPKVLAQVFKFTSLPFGLATAPPPPPPPPRSMIAKEVKLMALSRGLKLHQYLDDWLIRSQSQEEAQVNTQAVVDLTQSLGWIIDQEKSELKPTQVFSFVGYVYHLDSALVKPTQERWVISIDSGEWVISIDLSDTYLRIPIHPNSRKYLRFCYRFHVIQFTSLPFDLATAPQGFTIILKEVKLMALTRELRLHQYLDNWLDRSLSQEETQVNTQALLDLTQSLGWIINQEKSELKPTLCENHLDSALVKPTQERWLKLQDLILRLKSKHVLTARCLMSVIGLLASREKLVPEGRLHMRPCQFHLKEHWKYPQSLDSLLPWTETISAYLDWWQNPTNVMIRADLHPKTTGSNSLQTPQTKAVSLALRSFKDQCQNQTMLVTTDNSTVVTYINKQGGTHSVEMCTLLWKIMTWCHRYHITLKARHIPGCLNVMAFCPGRTKFNQQNGHCTLRCSNGSVRSGSPLI